MLSNRAVARSIGVRPTIHAFDKVPVGDRLIRAKRPLGRFLPQPLDLQLQFVVRAQINETARKLRREGLGNRLQKAIEIAGSAHRSSILQFGGLW